MNTVIVIAIEQILCKAFYPTTLDVMTPVYTPVFLDLCKPTYYIYCTATPPYFLHPNSKRNYFKGI